ncbi:MAG: hypothetical protein HYX24_02215 [Candidatus Aenigmarchaeota archaeon]|nr:hypothetical protein [Candidatus Aenigmarchaeota archaeon]
MPDVIQDLRGRLVTVYSTFGVDKRDRYKLEFLGTVGRMETEGLKIKRLQFTGPDRKRYFNDS